MRIIKLFEDFNNSNELFIFDFDDSLTFAPSFEEKAWDYLTEDLAELVDRSLSYINVSNQDIKIDNDRLYVDDPEKKIELKGNWVRKGNRVYMVTPHKWSFIDESFPTQLTPLAELYKKVQNKAIVTARPEDVRQKLTKVITELGLEQPNFGLYMFPREAGSGTPGAWKADEIINLIKETGFKIVYFYDDNPKIVNRVTREVNKEFVSSIKFKSYRVKEGNI